MNANRQRPTLSAAKMTVDRNDENIAQFVWSRGQKNNSGFSGIVRATILPTRTWPRDLCTFTKVGLDRLRFAGVVPERLIFQSLQDLIHCCQNHLKKQTQDSRDNSITKSM